MPVCWWRPPHACGASAKLGGSAVWVRKLAPPPAFTLVGYEKEQITVGDNTFDCWVMTATDPNGFEWKWYVCPDVPVTGYVRIERDGKKLLEIMEWGEE